MHAEQRVIARHLRLPLRQRPGDAVAQQALLPGVEVDQMAGLQGQDVLRPGDGQVLEHPAGSVPAAGQQFAERHQVGALAGVARQGAGRAVRLGGHRQALGFGAQQVQPGLQHVGHEQLRALRQGIVELGQRVADVTLEVGQGALVAGQAVGVGAGHSQPQVITHGHDEILMLAVVASGAVVPGAWVLR